MLSVRFYFSWVAPVSVRHVTCPCHVTTPWRPVTWRSVTLSRCHNVASAHCHVAWRRFVTRSCGKHLTDAITTSSGGKLSQAARARILPAEINFGSGVVNIIGLLFQPQTKENEFSCHKSGPPLAERKSIHKNWVLTLSTPIYYGTFVVNNNGGLLTFILSLKLWS